MTDYSVAAQPVSEDIANLEQMLEGMRFRAAPLELVALNRLFATARAKAQALEARVAAAEQDTRRLISAICDFGFAGTKDLGEDYGTRIYFTEGWFTIPTDRAEKLQAIFELGAALGAIPQEESRQ